MKFSSNKIWQKILAGFLISVFSMSTLNGQTRKKAADFSAKQPKINVINTVSAVFTSDKKFALVIGNSEYESSPLRNPVNDAQLIGQSLSEIGFQTAVKENLSLSAMSAAIQNFTRQLPKGSVGLFYFAGHGIQIDGRNFLIPTDFNPAQTDVAKQAIDVESVINAVAGKSALNILILDACRNAPKGFSVSSANKKGLAEIKNAPIGTYIAFSTAPGKTAKDGTGDNSPYSQSLADNLRLRPSRLEDVFIRTRIQTDNLTGGEQTPWESSSLRTVFHFTEDTFAETSDVGFKPPIVKHSGSLLRLPVVVPILNESGRQINTLPQTASYFVENDFDLQMMQIRGGKFAMGTSWQEVEAAYKGAKKYKSETNEDEEDGEDEEDETDKELKSIPAEMPQHQVNVPGFFISKHEITQAQWQTVMGKLPDGVPGKFRGADLPVVNISWRQADEFCQKLSAKTGKNYRLPTEAEWEYAARAGSSTAFAFGKTINSSLVNYRGNAPFLAAASGIFRNAPVPVGSLNNLNGFGLADMHGNVWEWTADNWHDEYNGAPTDGSAWEAGAPTNDDEDPRLFRVIRGGSWDSTASSCRSSHRRRYPQIIRSTKIGFRVVMN